MYAILRDTLSKGQHCMVSGERKVSFFSQRLLTEFSFDAVFSKKSTASQSSLHQFLKSEANDLLSTNCANVYLVFEALGESSYGAPHPLVTRFVANAMELSKKPDARSAEGENSSNGAASAPEEESRLGLSLATVSQHELTDLLLEYLNSLEKQKRR